MLLIHRLDASLQSLMPAADTPEVDAGSQGNCPISIGFSDLNGTVSVCSEGTLSSKARRVDEA